MRQRWAARRYGDASNDTLTHIPGSASDSSSVVSCSSEIALARLSRRPFPTVVRLASKTTRASRSIEDAPLEQFRQHAIHDEEVRGLGKGTMQRVSAVASHRYLTTATGQPV
jgi:hypothetical protein